jgi:capsule biosynthesis phosphatase
LADQGTQAGMKRLVVDLDGTITREELGGTYTDKQPDIELVARLREYKELGFEIIIYTARNMRTFENSIGKINAHTLPIIIDWLRRHDIPFDEIHVGKPWCGTEGFYVDDRAIRPSEFVRLSLEEIRELIGKTSAS